MLRRTFSALNWLALTPLASRAPVYGRLLLELLADKRIPMSHKAILGLAAGYLVMPIDLVPDFVPVLGRIDDVAVVVLALDLFLELVPRELLHEKLVALDIDGRELERDLARVRRLVPRPIRMLAVRLPNLFEKAAAAARRTIARTQASAASRASAAATEDAPA